MKQVAKVIIIDPENNYLLLRRSDHPRFPNDPDLPGGTIEAGENQLEALIREVFEEAGVTLDPDTVSHLYSGTKYSAHQTAYHLYIARVAIRPNVDISWEHATYGWWGQDEFMRQVGAAADTYMHMVHNVMQQETPSA